MTRSKLVLVGVAIVLAMGFLIRSFSSTITRYTLKGRNTKYISKVGVIRCTENVTSVIFGDGTRMIFLVCGNTGYQLYNGELTELSHYSMELNNNGEVISIDYAINDTEVISISE